MYKLTILYFILIGFLPMAILAETSSGRVFVDADKQKVFVPARPKKIVVVDEVDLDAMLALGLKPFGSTMGRGQNQPSRYLGSKTEGIKRIGTFFRPNIELLVMEQPDLILAGGFPVPNDLKRMKTIAPVANTYNLGEDWKTAFFRIATLFDAKEKYHAFMANYNQRVTSIAKKLAAKNLGTISVVRWNPKGPTFMQNSSFAVLVLKDLGLTRPTTQDEEGIAHSHVLSLEALNLIDADIIMIGTLSAKGEANSAMGLAMSSPAFLQLKAAKSKQVYEVDGSLWTSLGGPLAAMQIIDTVERLLLN